MASHTRYQSLLGIAEFGLNRFQQAIVHLEHAVQASPYELLAATFLVSAYGHVGRNEDEAKRLAEHNQAREDLRLFELMIVGVEDASLPFPFREHADTYRLIEGLQMAGVPDASLGWPPSDYSSR